MINNNPSQETSHASNTKLPLTTLSDKNLYQLCKNYGYESLKWRWKFIGLLPEVNRRRLYEKKGFESIYVFAQKLAGISEKQVRRALNLKEKFEKLPTLQNLLTNGEISVNKLARVASIANENNEKFLVENLKNLSNRAVETLVRDEKRMNDSKNQNGLFEPEIEPKSVHVHTLLILELSPEVQEKLLDLKNKGFDINQLILEFLQKRDQETVKEKQQISQEVLQREETKISRHIPIKVRQILHKEHGKKCSIKNCQKPSQQIHHIIPFSICRTHDPRLLAPLCKDHHELQHAVNERYIEARR